MNDCFLSILCLRNLKTQQSSVIFDFGKQGWHNSKNARLPPVWPGFDSRTRRHMWVDFVVVSLLCSERFFSRYSRFPLSSKTNISKFQFHSGMHWHFKQVLVNSWCSIGKQITLTSLHFFVFEEKAHGKFQIVFHPHKN